MYVHISCRNPFFHVHDFRVDLFFEINLFIFGCIASSLMHGGFLYLRQAGATLCCGARICHCCGPSRCGAWARGTRASVIVTYGVSSCGSWALECRLSSCGAWSQLLRSMWDHPGSGLEPMSPALAGGLPTTAPRGKSQSRSYRYILITCMIPWAAHLLWQVFMCKWPNFFFFAF